MDDHENKYGYKIPDRKAFLDVSWPKNVLHHVLSAYHQRTSFIGTLSRSRTSLNLLGTTPNMARRRSISPGADTARTTKSATGTARRVKLAKTQKFGSTTNLKLVSEKVSGFSVFSGPDLKRDPILAYGKEFEKPTEKRTGIERSRATDKKRGDDTPVRPYRAKLNRQSMSEQLFKQLNDPKLQTDMKRSTSQNYLNKDAIMEAVVIDSPDNSRYNTIKSNSTFGTEGSDSEYDGVASDRHFSRWGVTRGSNSYSNASNVPVSQLSTVNLKDVKKQGPGDSAV